MDYIENLKLFYSINYKSLFNYRKFNRFNRIINEIDHYSPRNILDVGCGTGGYCIFLKNKGYDIKGVDIDSKKLSEGLQFDKSCNISYGSATKLPFENEKFDLVLITEVMEHIKEHDKAIKEASRVLNKNGIIIITVPTRKYSKWLGNYEYGHVRDCYTVDELKDLLSHYFNIEHCGQCGFYIENIIKYIDLRINKHKSSDLLTKSKPDSILFKLYKYAFFPIISLLLILDNLFQAKEGLNIIIVAKKKWLNWKRKNIAMNLAWDRIGIYYNHTNNLSSCNNA